MTRNFGINWYRFWIWPFKRRNHNPQRIFSAIWLPFPGSQHYMCIKSLGQLHIRSQKDQWSYICIRYIIPIQQFVGKIHQFIYCMSHINTHFISGVKQPLVVLLCLKYIRTGRTIISPYTFKYTTSIV